MSVPSIDHEARTAALDKARRARRVRSELKQLLASGETTLAEVLDRTDHDAVARMRVVEVLTALPAIGPVKAARAMDEVGIAESRRLGGLGQRQRAALVERFG